MAEIGKFNTLKVVKVVDFGVYLDGGNNVEILLPARYLAHPMHIGDEIEVFIYTDSEDRLIATTEIPYIKVGEFAQLRVKQTNRVGTFMDWGLQKDLLVPFSEQRSKMREGGEYIVYAYLDDNTKRIVASSKIDKFVGNTLPEYKKGEEVNALVWQNAEIGYKVVVNNLHHGMIYHNELFRDLSVGEVVKAYVKNVRTDGKIDLTLSDKAQSRIGTLAEDIYQWLSMRGGESGLCDKSSPEEIKKIFQCSKKDFKKAIGQLFKEHRIVLNADGMKIV